MAIALLSVLSPRLGRLCIGSELSSIEVSIFLDALEGLVTAMVKHDMDMDHH